MKNRKLISSLLLLFTLCFIPLDINAQEDVSISPDVYVTEQPDQSNTGGASTYANDIRWLYKSVNGVIYRRKYDFTLNRWVGDWERVN